ncbi:S1C family serine protease [Breoghania sp.]|uniref:S1C family serine protease n=1 Tax=Breoghania sp. TaxID=2065378 RepID=UPI00261FFA2A|nr:S1C family serine protease [Breoghania sp.]MDJ0930648.1 S1C family serine protease [Breoghania sp.]
MSFGTGFKVAEPGIVVTNYYVIRNADDLYVFYRQNDKVEQVPMRIMWHDRDQDLAILRGLSDVPGEVLTLADIDESQLHKRD